MRGNTNIQTIPSSFCTKTIGVPSKKLRMKMGKARGGHPDPENTNFSSQGACSFPGSKHLLALEAVRERFQMEFPRRINALLMPNFIPHILRTYNDDHSVWHPPEDKNIGSLLGAQHKVGILLELVATLSYSLRLCKCLLSGS